MASILRGPRAATRAAPAGLTAVISPALLSAVSSLTKTYDGTTVASLSGSSTNLTGFVNLLEGRAQRFEILAGGDRHDIQQSAILAHECH